MRNDNKVYNWLNNVHALLYPPLCILCGAPAGNGVDLCAGCRADLLLNTPSCNRCAAPLPQGAGAICGECLRRPPPFERALVPYRYAPPLDHLLLSLKFAQRLAPARLLGTLLTEAITAAQGPLPELIVPIPLHAARLQERGYNQAVELARPVASSLGIPLSVSLLHRDRDTPAQSRLDRRQRLANMRGAFLCTRRPPPHVALLDDVVTTGATVRAAATALRRAGAERVEVWACARVAAPAGS